MTKLSTEQTTALEAKLHPERVKSRKAPGGKTVSYIEGWDAIATANRIFGFDGWSRETSMCEQVGDVQTSRDAETGIDTVKVMFRARVRVTVGAAVRDGSALACGSGRTWSDAFDNAIKTVETDATKRALATFGNQFGLALYDKEMRQVGREPETIDASALTVGFADRPIPGARHQPSISERARPAGPWGDERQGHNGRNGAPAATKQFPLG